MASTKRERYVEAPKNSSLGEFDRFWRDLYLSLFRKPRPGFKRILARAEWGADLNGTDRDTIMVLFELWGVKTEELSPAEVLLEVERRFGGMIPLDNA